MPLLGDKKSETQDYYDKKFAEIAAFNGDKVMSGGSDEMKKLGIDGPRYTGAGNISANFGAAATGAAAGAAGAAGASVAADGMGKLNDIRDKTSYIVKYSKPLAATATAGTLGIIGFNSLNAGPFQLLHVGQMLSDFHLADGEDISDSRVTKAWRYLRDPDDPGNRRLSSYARSKATKIDARMKNAGYTITHTKASGVLQSLDIDTTKTDLSVDETRNKYLDMGFKDTNIVVSGDTVTIKDLNSDGFHPRRNTRLLKDSLSVGGYGKVTTWRQLRILKIKHKVSFNVIGHLDANIKDGASNKWSEWREKQVTEINEGAPDRSLKASGEKDSSTGPNGEVVETENTKNNAVADEVGDFAGADNAVEAKTKLRGGLAKGAGAVGFIVGVGCMINAIGDAAADLSYQNVNLPTMRLAWQVISIRSQIMSGQNVDFEELGFHAENLFQAAQPPSQEDIDAANEFNRNPPDGAAPITAQGTPASAFSDSKDWQYEEGRPQDGFDPPPELKMKNSNILTDITDKIPGLDQVCEVADSFIGGVVTFTIDFVSGPVAASIGFIAGQILGPVVSDYLVKWVADDLVNPLKTAGANFGSYMNFGTAFAESEFEASRGGKILSKPELAQWQSYGVERLRIAQSEKPIMERLFSKTDARSFLSSFARTMPHDKVAAINSVIKSPLTFVSSLGNLMPATQAYAQSAEPFDYGFDQYGFSIAELEDKKYENPYLNEDLLRKGLKDEKDWTMQQAHDEWGVRCFGIKINDNDSLKIQALEGKNPKDRLTECKDAGGKPEGGDALYDRYRFYVLDIMNLKSIACGDGDEAACGELGQSSGKSGSSGGGKLDDVTCPETLEAHPSIEGYFKMPDASDGEYSIYASDGRRYGSKMLICVMDSVSKAYNKSQGGKSKVQIGDLNAGAPHKSHGVGVAVDLFASGSVVAADTTKAGYSTEATIELGKLFVDTGKVKNIWWCDGGDGSSEAIVKYAEEKGKPVNLTCIEGHHNHFHVDIADEYKLGQFAP